MKNKWLKIISIIQIVGGITGIYIGSPLYKIPSGNIIIDLNAALFLIPFIVSFIAGVLLWQANFIGIVLSIIIQGLQIIQFSITSFIYYIFYSGIKFCLDFSWPIIGFSGEVGSQLDFVIGAHYKPFMININILALVCFIHLMKSAKQRNVEK